MKDDYRALEIMDREPIDVIEYESRHDPEESIRLVYYLKCTGDVIDVAGAFARDETTGPWVGTSKETATFRKAQSDLERVELYAPDEAVVVARSPMINLNPDGDLLYQFLMISIGGPALEFVYYDQVAFIDFELPPKLLRYFPGPKFGIRGTRKLLGLGDDEPVIGTIVKPCAGLTHKEAAAKIIEAAAGGCRFIKDDEKMMGPAYCDHEKRIRLVAEGLGRVRQESGRYTIYAPHFTSPPDRMREDALRAIEWGATGLMFNPLMTGLGSMLALAEDPDVNVPLYAHSGGRSGWSTGPRRVDDVVMAKLIRLAGGDYFQIGVMGQMDVHVASRVPRMLRRLDRVFKEPLTGIRDTVPVTAGGLDVRNLPLQFEAFGNNVMPLAGSGILKHPAGIKAGVDAMMQSADSFRKGVSLEDYAKTHKELAQALAL